MKIESLWFFSTIHELFYVFIVLGVVMRRARHDKKTFRRTCTHVWVKVERRFSKYPAHASHAYVWATNEHPYPRAARNSRNNFKTSAARRQVVFASSFYALLGMRAVTSNTCYMFNSVLLWRVHAFKVFPLDSMNSPAIAEMNRGALGVIESGFVNIRNAKALIWCDR